MVRIENLREEPVDIDKEVALLRREIRQAREALLNVPLEEARKRTNIGTLRQRFVWAAAVVLHTNEEEDGKKVAICWRKSARHIPFNGTWFLRSLLLK